MFQKVKYKFLGHVLHFQRSRRSPCAHHGKTNCGDEALTIQENVVSFILPNTNTHKKNQKNIHLSHSIITKSLIKGS